MKLKNITKFVILCDLSKKENRPKNLIVRPSRAVSVFNGMEHPSDLYVIPSLTAQSYIVNE